MTSNTRGEDEQPPEPKSLITSLPKDVIFDILRRLPRYEYSTLSLVSKQFRSLVTSPELYEIRSLIGVTEPFFYALFYDSQSRNTRWHILHRKANGNLRLALIHSLPAMDDDGSFVAVGSSIYVFGGSDDRTKYRALKIDCRLHTVEQLPSMPVPMSNTIADIIDGRIYVIGDLYNDKSKKVMVVFNTETQLWELGTTKQNIEFGHTCLTRYAVMDGKLYMSDYVESNVYELKKCKWEREREREREREDRLNFHNWRNASVVDNILYYYDYDYISGRSYERMIQSRGTGEWWKVWKNRCLRLDVHIGQVLLVAVGNWFWFFLAKAGEQVTFGVLRYRWRNVKEERFGVNLSGVIRF